MGILSKATSKFNDMIKARRTAQAERLLKDTEEAESKFKSEAKKLGIDLRNITVKNYYELLGIKYTNDHKAIRQAYLGMVKRYHPDVSKDKDAAKKSADANEAYSVLKDSKNKEEYDKSFSKGKNNMGPDVTKSITNLLMKKYSEIRDEDFKEFNERVSSPQTRDAINAAINDVLDWNRAFNKARSQTIGGLIDCGVRIRRLASVNRSMLKHGHGHESTEKLSRNLENLEAMEKSFADIEGGIGAIISGAKEKIQEDESRAAAKLRG